jgi:hypothetical protein
MVVVPVVVPLPVVPDVVLVPGVLVLAPVAPVLVNREPVLIAVPL